MWCDPYVYADAMRLLYMLLHLPPNPIVIVDAMLPLALFMRLRWRPETASS